MDLLKFFFKDEVEAVGLCKFRDKEYLETNYDREKNHYFEKQYFKPDYSNNFFLL